jgi:hypothetical protein
MRFSARIGRTLLKPDDGTTAIEFAIVAPVLILLIMGIMEFGLIYYAKNVLENAVAVGARIGITGSDYAGNNRVAKPDDAPTDRVKIIKENIYKRSSGLLKEEQISVSCTNAGQTFGNLSGSSSGSYGCGDTINNDSSCTTGGGGNDAVIYTARYCWKVFTPMIGQFFDNGQVVVQSSLVVKNENF